MTDLTTQNYGSPLLSIPPQCLFELAAEIEETGTIAKRWGIPEKELKALMNSPSIRHQLESKRAELKNSGATFRMKAEILAEEVMLDVYKQALEDDAPRGFKLEVAKWLTKIADREPKPSSMAPGTGFTLQINIPATDVSSAQTIDVTPTHTPQPEYDSQPILELPEWLREKAASMAEELGADDQQFDGKDTKW